MLQVLLFFLTLINDKDFVITAMIFFFKWLKSELINPTTSMNVFYHGTLFNVSARES